nr:hypothetical protein [Tanacetum cinerariifolium]
MVLNLDTTMTTQAMKIDSLKRRVKKLEKKQRSRTHKLKRLYKVGLTTRVESSDNNKDLGEDASKQERISDIDADEGITLVSTHDDAEMFDVDKDLNGEDVFVVKQDENVVEKKLMLLKFKTKTCNEKAQQEEEVNSALIEEWNDIQAKTDADYLLAQRLQAEEQQELTNSKKATLFMQFLKKMRKFFTAKEAEEKRNKPPTQAQQRKIMCTYLTNTEGKKLKDLKNKSFNSIQKMFDKAFKRVNTFEPISLELVEESSKKAKTEVMKKSSKKAGTKLEQESPKKQKIDDAKK